MTRLCWSDDACGRACQGHGQRSPDGAGRSPILSEEERRNAQRAAHLHHPVNPWSAPFSPRPAGHREPVSETEDEFRESGSRSGLRRSVLVLTGFRTDRLSRRWSNSAVSDALWSPWGESAAPCWRARRARLGERLVSGAPDSWRKGDHPRSGSSEGKGFSMRRALIIVDVQRTSARAAAFR